MTHDDYSLLISIEEDTISSLSSLLGDQEEVIRDLKDEVNWLHAELHGAEMKAKKAAELKAENRRLRSCLEDAAENDRLTTHEFNQLKEERDKLRELLAETLMPYRDYAKKYGIAPYLTDVNEHLDARMRELGIEVDE